ncbi:MAG TPA: alcohol dehydrogenase catalytic domain-containing protein [Chloroflexota bacterium]|nr:alcohol dehydrogenase catalytic domain-containing protein [Chloroflexota bacterium]
MRALRIVGERQVVVREKPEPRPGPGEVVVKMRAAAICGSDLHPYRHPRPADLEGDLIPGHEPCGEIAAVGSEVRGWQVGDRVVVYFRRTCGDCYYCRSGHRNVCVNRRSSYGVGADGSDAEYMAVEAPSLMRLPDDFSYVDGAVLACQAGTAYYPLTRLGASGRDVLVVSGLGPVGLLATMFATAMGARVVGIDPSAPRREQAARLGAQETLDPTAGPIGEQLRARYPQGADKLIETSGSNAAHAVIGDLLKPLGQVAIVGLGSQSFTMPLMSLVHRQLTLFGTSIYPDTMFDEICGFVRRHGLRLETVVSHYFDLDEGPEAFRIADTATTGKVCFRFE